MPDRTCDLPDCNRKHRARGLCGTHYNEVRFPDRHRKVEMACTQCGVTVMKFPAGKRKPFCSWPCQDAYQHADPAHTWGRKPRVRSTELELHPNPVRPVPKVVRVKPRKFVAGFCQACRDPYIGLTTSMTCSAKCAEIKLRSDRSDHKHRRRMAERDAFVAPVYRIRIYQRDRWQCQICRRKVNRHAVAPHPQAPTIDHIIPLSQGGTHEPANVRLACFMCNATRGDRGGWEQLALIG